jgi:hypothetical protein
MYLEINYSLLVEYLPSSIRYQVTWYLYDFLVPSTQRRFVEIGYFEQDSFGNLIGEKNTTN